MRALFGPLKQLYVAESAGGLLLLALTTVALLWANSPWAPAYFALWEPLRHWVNDGLMAFFFLAVGLELKRELLDGALASMKRAAMPAIAAIGGMLMPAVIYLAFNPDAPTSAGWGIPIATDIAFV